MSQWDAERHARLQLHLVAGVGPRTQQCLLEHFGSASSALAATQGELQQVPRVGLKLAERIVAAAHEDAALPVLEVCRESAVQVLLHGDDGYPSPLSHIPDPPGALFVRGGWMEADALSVAIVGSRHATRYGLNQAERLGRGLALHVSCGNPAWHPVGLFHPPGRPAADDRAAELGREGDRVAGVSGWK